MTTKSKKVPNNQIEAIALGKIEPGNMLIQVGFDCKTGLPIVTKWNRR